MLKEINDRDWGHKFPQVTYAGNVWSSRGREFCYDSNVISFGAFTHTISRSQPALCYMVEINNLAQSVMVQGTAFKVGYYSILLEAAAFNIQNV